MGSGSISISKSRRMMRRDIIAVTNDHGIIDCHCSIIYMSYFTDGITRFFQYGYNASLAKPVDSFHSTHGQEDGCCTNLPSNP